MKRIAFVIGSLYRGGAERVISVLANEYIQHDCYVDILLLLSGTVGYQIDSRIKIYDFSGGSGADDSRIKRLPMWLHSIRTYMKQNRPDAILSFACRINVITLLASRGLKQRVFVSERIDPRFDNRGKVGDILSKLLYPKAEKVIFQTKKEQDYFKGLKNGVIIPNPVSVTTYASEKKSKKIVTVGRMAPQKNHKMLINAFESALPDFPEYVLEIYGDGISQDETRQYIKNKHLEDKVRLKGNVPNVQECIADAELFVLSSDYEGLSNALLEAMMMGLPVITTDVSGTDEAVQDGDNGLVVPVKDEKAMAEAMKKMLSDSKFRKSCGERAKVTASERFNKEVVMDKWFKTLRVDLI